MSQDIQDLLPSGEQGSLTVFDEMVARMQRALGAIEGRRPPGSKNDFYLDLTQQERGVMMRRDDAADEIVERNVEKSAVRRTSDQAHSIHGGGNRPFAQGATGDGGRCSSRRKEACGIDVAQD